MEKGGLITVRVGMERKENNIWRSNCQKMFHFLGKKCGNTHSDTDIRVCSDHGVDPDPEIRKYSFRYGYKSLLGP